VRSHSRAGVSSAGSRHAIGTGVIGGMPFATFVATFFIRLFFFWIAGRTLGTGKPNAEE
jgi:multidrug efflux pump subunit AcrB